MNDCITCTRPGQNQPQCPSCLAEEETHGEMTTALQNAIEDCLARNLSCLTVKDGMVDAQDVKAMHEAAAANLAMAIIELVRV